MGRGRVTPTEAEVLAYVGVHEPVTCDEVRLGLAMPWERRGTVRNRLDYLVWDGTLVRDDTGWPARYAVNQLAESSAP